MDLTEKEIMSQHEALKKTYDLFMDKKDETEKFFEKNGQRKFTILGCGSSYMLAKSAARLLSAVENTEATAIAGGDLLIHEEYYKNNIKDSIVIVLSRSGQTSEIVRDIEMIRKDFDVPMVTMTMKDDNALMPMSELDFTMDWCYDKSVCQTRTVTNLYAAMLLFTALYSGDDKLVDAVRKAVDANEAYKEDNRPALKAIAQKDWENAIVLADGALTGLAEEGALAFSEIAMLPGQCFNMLDYRHGPIVLNGEKTLTIVLLSPEGGQLEADMIADLKTHNGILVTVSTEEDNRFDADAHICVGDIDDFRAEGIPFIYVMQMLAYEKSKQLGRNPDAPTGLDAFITLK